MALELLPDGTFKKLTKVQTDALNRYYKRENKRDLTTEAIISGLPIILGVSIASIAYIFRDDIKEKVLTALEEEAIGAGLWVAKGITRFISSQGPYSGNQQFAKGKWFYQFHIFGLSSKPMYSSQCSFHKTHRQ